MSLLSVLRISRLVPRAFSSIEYAKAADASLERLSDYVNDLGDVVDEEIDVSLSMGVLNIAIDRVGTYVINKQTPNEQLWLSSPISGPKRYDLRDGKWVYSHDGQSLDSLLNQEFTKIFPKNKIDFSSHV